MKTRWEVQYAYFRVDNNHWPFDLDRKRLRRAYCGAGNTRSDVDAERTVTQRDARSHDNLTAIGRSAFTESRVGVYDRLQPTQRALR